MVKLSSKLLVLLVLVCPFFVVATPSDELTSAMKALLAERSLKGMQVQITKQKEVIYDLNLGQKNEAGQPIDKDTVFRIASVSKSFSSIAIMQLV